MGACADPLPPWRATFVPLSECFVARAARARSRATFVPLSERFVAHAARARSHATFVPLSECFVARAARARSRATFVPLSEPFVARMPVDRGLWQLARRQHGALATAQLVAAGVSRAQI